MKRIIAVLLAAALLIMTGCRPSIVAPGDGSSADMKLILNGKKLDVYTMHYFHNEEFTSIPLEAFLCSLGAEYADSSANEDGKQCYSFQGKRYVIVPDLHLFMEEGTYLELMAEGKDLTRENVADLGLLPRNKCKVCADSDESDVELAEMWVDHISLMKALRESGIDITIAYDYSAITLSVILPELDS